MGHETTLLVEIFPELLLRYAARDLALCTEDVLPWHEAATLRAVLLVICFPLEVAMLFVDGCQSLVHVLQSQIIVHDLQQTERQECDDEAATDAAELAAVVRGKARAGERDALQRHLGCLVEAARLGRNDAVGVIHHIEADTADSPALVSIPQHKDVN